MREVEVLVVGAGPAGATTAREFARRGVGVLLVDRVAFPRAKCCAGWVNARVSTDFEWLGKDESSWRQNTFREVVIHSADLSRSARYRADGIGGSFVQRERFDGFLAAAAEAAGARFEVREFQGLDGEIARFSDREEVRAKVVVAADGCMSRVAVDAGVRPRQRSREAGELVACVNLDAEDPRGEEPAMHLVPMYMGIPGYGWVFQKGGTLSAGIGGAAGKMSEPKRIFERFLSDLAGKGLVPVGISAADAKVAYAPAGGAQAGTALVRGNVVAVGDAGGFVRDANGEGIYPGMLSGRLAADVIAEALGSGDVRGLDAFAERSRGEIGPRLRSENATALTLMPVVFQDARVAARMARYFLFGEPLL
ncbi:MAG: NAD(P)/FAD-dependent oxidoreductase [Planctomycetota bacterium]